MDFKSLMEKVNDAPVLSVATVSEEGGPAVRFIDEFFTEDGRLYFFTARGKDLCSQLIKDPRTEILCSYKLNVSVRLRGKVRRLEGDEKEIYLNRMFNKKLDLQSLYPGHARDAGEIFVLEEPEVRYLNRSVFPITRHFYGTDGVICDELKGYHILDHCVGCGICLRNCPKKAVAAGKPYRIIYEKCIDCGYCEICCPVDAIKKY